MDAEKDLESIKPAKFIPELFEDKTRIYFLDYLRAFIILVVVVEHAALPYIVAESNNWFFFDPNTNIVFSAFVVIAHLIIRPTLFFVSGYFFLPSLVKRGPIKLIKAKLRRLGIPLVFGIIFVNPIAYYLARVVRGTAEGGFLHFFFNTWLIGEAMAPAHLWFLESLFMVIVIFSLYFSLNRNSQVQNFFDSSWSIFKFGLILAIVFFLGTIAVGGDYNFRIDFIGNGLIRIQPARFVFYLFYFYLGVGLSQSPHRGISGALAGRKLCFWMGLTVFLNISLVAFLASYYAAIAESAKLILINSFLRAFGSLSFLITLLIIFRRYLNFSSRLGVWLSGNSYPVYVVHLPIVVIIQFWLLPWQISAFGKFVIVSALSIPLSYLSAEFVLKRIPGLKTVF